jgi:prolyl oligopeptidase
VCDGQTETEIFFNFTSFVYPGVIFHYDLPTKALKVFRTIELKGFDPTQFVVKQVFYASKDSTKIPMFIVHKKVCPLQKKTFLVFVSFFSPFFSQSLELNGDNPCYLYGYGGFNISITPSFSVSRVIWMQHFNGIIAIANIRGGFDSNFFSYNFGG